MISNPLKKSNTCLQTSVFPFHKCLWKSFIVLSIVKVLGSILADVMLIPGKAKNILKVGSMTTQD